MVGPGATVGRAARPGPGGVCDALRLRLRDIRADRDSLSDLALSEPSSESPVKLQPQLDSLSECRHSGCPLLQPVRPSRNDDDSNDGTLAPPHGSSYPSLTLRATPAGSGTRSQVPQGPTTVTLVSLECHTCSGRGVEPARPGTSWPAGAVTGEGHCAKSATFCQCSSTVISPGP